MKSFVYIKSKNLTIKTNGKSDQDEFSVCGSDLVNISFVLLGSLFGISSNGSDLLYCSLLTN